MAGFATFDEILQAGTNNSGGVLTRAQTKWFDKVLPNATVAATPYSLWSATGIPTAGTFPATNVGATITGAITQDSSVQGAIPFTNASGGRTLHLISTFLQTSGVGNYLLVDRLATATVLNSQGVVTVANTFSPAIDGTARLASGEGGMIFCEVSSALTTVNTMNFTYTNQAGTAGKTSGTLTTVLNAVVRRVPYVSTFFLPLAAGDTGVRSIEGQTWLTGAGTGEINVSIVKPIALFTPGVTNEGYDFDFVWSNYVLPRIKDGACLQLIFMPNTTATGNVWGNFQFVEN